MTQKDIVSTVQRYEESPPRIRTEEHIVDGKGRSFGQEVVTPSPVALAFIAATHRS